jgi:hypothetical protein
LQLKSETMPRWIVAALVVGYLCAPHFAFARTDEGQSGDSLSISKEQALVVGAGIVGGALVLHLVVPGDYTYFAGGVVGGLAALWWYENGGETTLRPLLNPDRAAASANSRDRSILRGIVLAR